MTNGGISLETTCSVVGESKHLPLRNVEENHFMPQKKYKTFVCGSFSYLYM